MREKVVDSSCAQIPKRIIIQLPIGQAIDLNQQNVNSVAPRLLCTETSQL
jgi:hypothetical protein